MEESTQRLSATSRRVSKGVENSKPAVLDRERLEAFMLDEEPSRITDTDFRALQTLPFNLTNSPVLKFTVCSTVPPASPGLPPRSIRF